MNKAIYELITSERNYVQQLNTFLNTTSKQLLAISQDNQVKAIINQFKMISKFNYTLLEDLEVFYAKFSKNEKDEDYTIGKIFLKLAPFLKFYSDYYSNYDKNYQFLQQILKDKKIEGDILKIMTIPFLRLSKYSTSLEELSEFDPTDEYLKQAHEKFQQVLVDLDTQSKKNDSKNRLLEVQKRLPTTLNIVAPHRHHIFDGELNLIPKYGIEARVLQKKLVFLFSDMILICTIDPNNMLNVEYNINLETVPIAWIKNVNKELFQLVCQEGTFTFYFKDEKEKERLRMVFNDTIDNVIFNGNNELKFKIDERAKNDYELTNLENEDKGMSKIDIKKKNDLILTNLLNKLQ